KKANVAVDGKLPSKFTYLVKNYEEQDFEPAYIVSVDVADVKLLGSNREAYEGRIDLCIDHHMTNKIEAPLKCVDGNAAANCEILYKLFRLMQVDITRGVANNLYTGISTDTGCFRYTNTTAETLRIAADIIDIGCDTAYINKVMFETKTRKKLALEREVYNTMEYCCNDRCAIIAVTLATQKKVGVGDGELEGLASIPRQVEGVKIGITLREKAENDFKISVRSDGDVNAAEFCARFGGGGHAAAAGCSVKGSLEEVKAQLKAAVSEIL
ncbi:bifunctional oligoribonuclease/PAP phosphatase NrnA, partial [Bifidobacterium sp.]|uniref:DHH family phosphoesterase n=1 Tax=Bifidobacterium sp. TaxID=41200 RepID=UPI003865CD14